MKKLMILFITFVCTAIICVDTRSISIINNGDIHFGNQRRFNCKKYYIDSNEFLKNVEKTLKQYSPLKMKIFSPYKPIFEGSDLSPTDSSSFIDYLKVLLRPSFNFPSTKIHYQTNTYNNIDKQNTPTSINQANIKPTKITNADPSKSPLKQTILIITKPKEEKLSNGNMIGKVITSEVLEIKNKPSLPYESYIEQSVDNIQNDDLEVSTPISLLDPLYISTTIEPHFQTSTLESEVESTTTSYDESTHLNNDYTTKSPLDQTTFAFNYIESTITPDEVNRLEQENEIDATTDVTTEKIDIKDYDILSNPSDLQKREENINFTYEDDYNSFGPLTSDASDKIFGNFSQDSYDTDIIPDVTL